MTSTSHTLASHTLASHTLAFLAQLVEGELAGDGSLIIEGVAPFEEASANQITFAQSARHVKKLGQSRAGAIIVPTGHALPDRNTIAVDNPQIAFIKLVHLFHPPAKITPGIHPTAVIGEGTTVGASVTIGPHVTIGRRVRIGGRARIGAGVVIEEDVVIGTDVQLSANVTIHRGSCLGDRVIIHSGTVIGADGFGFVPGPSGAVKIPQIGTVQIDDDVEIGANTTIDRATFGKTWIQEGVKIDNLVMIGHNCTVGAHSIIVAQAGVAGSVKIGRGAILASRCGIGDHLEIGDGATIGPKAGVAKNVPPGQTVIGGIPAMPYKEWLRMQRVVRLLPDLKKRLDELSHHILKGRKKSD
jgi:UDP-3-O-[3-hydroxymyristoyl] glucosamine N-acyltransferase